MFISLCEAVTLISDVESQQRHSPKIALHIQSMKLRGQLTVPATGYCLWMFVQGYLLKEFPKMWYK